MNRKKTRFDFQKMKDEGEKLAWITAYDYPTAELAGSITEAFAAYSKEVRSGEFPAPEHTYNMVAGEQEKLLRLVK